VTNPLEAYLKEMRDIRGTGAAVAETSYYPALSTLLNEIGKTLKPKVRCVQTLADSGAGLPDFGMFTADQIRKKDPNPMQGQLPARGVIEVKGPGDDVKKIARSEQVKRYSDKYGVVLVTNYRDFLLLGRDAHGNPLPMEPFTLADGESAFWTRVCGTPQKTTREQGERFCEYLKRVMLSVAPLSAPQDVAWFLASYARDAKSRVENNKDLSALNTVRDALEEALGMKFTGEKGEHFFRSTLVQTIFYGVFSAWVLWHRERPEREDAFDWRIAEWSLHVPFIRALYEQVATPTKLGELGLVEVLDWTAAALNRVDRASFFQKFRDEHAVQYFYEPFLEAFDPELRKELGVWYTPPEIVQYQVARVDAVLRTELGLADGLADPNVVVLDPCCGTGAYLVEVLRKIAETLKSKGGDALLASDLKKAAMTRVFGFEILPAPFVVSHLQLGLILRNLGAPLSRKSKERVGVYLTNALTGWEPLDETKRIPFPELQAEHDAARHVKREERILVVLGNPPYNAFAGISPKEEKGLVEPYKEGLNKPVAAGGWGIKKFNLDDLYIRFFRLAERRIAEMSGKGVVSFISNFSFLGDPSFVVLRQRYLAEFDKLWLDCMNGDSRETGKLTPEGNPDPSVFSTEYNREGIRVGTTVSVIVRKAKRDKEPAVRFRHFWGSTKRQDLLNSLTSKRFDAAYTAATPCNENRHSFRPEKVSAEYNAWPKLPEITSSHYNGPVERRGNSLIVLDEGGLSVLQQYLDPSKSDDEIRAIAPAFMKSAGEFVAETARAKLKGNVIFDAKRIRKYPFKPCDVRFAYLDASIQPLFSRPSPDLLEHAGISANGFFITRDTADKTPEGPPFYFSPFVCDYDSISGHARHFPILLAPAAKGKKANGQGSFLKSHSASDPTANLSPAARSYLLGLGIKDVDCVAQPPSVATGKRKSTAGGGCATYGLIWMHALAIGYSPAYLFENADGIRRDWPRIPLPDSRKALNASAGLGRQLAALLDTEAEVSGVTAGEIEPIFRTIAVLTKVCGATAPGCESAAALKSSAEGGGATQTAEATEDTQLVPDSDDLAVTAGWGHGGKGGVTMPGRGMMVRRPYDKSEQEALRNAAEARGLSLSDVISLLGAETCDIYLNEKAYWKNIPINVWEYYIGGYQVVKKWLSYREQTLLGRPLKADEAREVTGMARRLARIVLLQPTLDANYRLAKAHAYAWPKNADEGAKG
jgi:hypothetical protein